MGYKYTININFRDVNSSLEDKMKIIEMIENLNINHRVGVLMIKMNELNVFSREMIMRMNANYYNLYTLVIIDENL